MQPSLVRGAMSKKLGSFSLLLEVDATIAAHAIADHKTHTGVSLSFTGFLVRCLARAVAENKQIYRSSRKQLQLEIHGVHVGVLLEHDADSARALTGHVIRAADRRTFRDIHDEIREVQSAPPSQDMLRRPRFLRRFFRRFDRTATVSLTSIGVGAGHSGWGVSTIPSPLDVVVGGLATKPVYMDGEPEPREILDLSLIFDCDVVDALAPGFVQQLVDLIENADGLDEIRPLDATPPPPRSNSRFLRARGDRYAG